MVEHQNMWTGSKWGKKESLSISSWFSSMVKGGACEHSCVHPLVSYVLARVFLFIFSMPFVCICKNWNELLWRLRCLNKKEVAKKRNAVVRRHSWSSMSKAFSAIKLTIWQRYKQGWLSIPFCLLKYSNMKTLVNSHPLPAVRMWSFMCWQRLSHWPVIIQQFQALDHLIITLHRDSIARTCSW